MALVLKDRVKETTVTVGTITLVLLGAASGFQSFSAIGNGNTTYYAIDGGTEWEVGIGTYTSTGTTLSRDTILSSSNSGSAVNFSTGTKSVFVTYPAGKGIYTDASGNAIALGTPASATLTNATGLPISTGVSGLGTNVATFLATPTSSNLAAAVTDETGSGSLVFATLPTFGTTGVKFSGSTSGTTTLLSGAAAGTSVLTLPVATDTLVGKATTDTLTNKTLTSPSLTTPVLGTPSSGTLTSCTGLPLTTGVTGTLPVANGGTGVTTSTGTGNTVLSASPTFTGTVVAPTINAGAATALTLQSAGTTALTIDTSQNATFNSTGAMTISSGTTAQRPASPVNGMTRYNTTTGTWEAYNNSGWIPSNPNIVTNYQSFTASGTFTPAAGVRNIQLLVVGGGGGGGSGGAGGGGAGGVVYIPNFAVTPSTGITVTIGGGGAASTNGVNSSFGSITAYGGGRGGISTDVSYGNNSGPYAGGSGGGSSATSTAVGSGAPASSQGSAGGLAPTISPFPAGGGGGAGQVGQNGASGVNGNGGDGVYIPIFSSYGASGYFGGGGAGGYTGNTSGSGGAGGGGGTNVAGTANTGGGGGGANPAKAGGSGVVVVAWYQ
jgi:hypothetical protein